MYQTPKNQLVVEENSFPIFQFCIYVFILTVPDLLALQALFLHFAPSLIIIVRRHFQVVPEPKASYFSRHLDWVKCSSENLFSTLLIGAKGPELRQ